MTRSLAWLKIGVVLGGVYLLSQVTPVFLPIILAVVLAFVLNPIVELLARVPLWPSSRRLPRGLAVLIAILLAALIVGTLVAFIFLPFIAEFNRFIASLPNLIEKIQHLTGVLERQAQTLDLPDNIRTLVDQTLATAASYALTIVRRVLDSTLNFASQIVELVVVPVLTFYFLKDWRFLKESFVELFPAKVHDKTRVIVEEIAAVVSGYIRGQVLISIIVGSLVFIGVIILEVDYPLVLGLLAMLTETIPIIGPIIGATPAIFLAYLHSPALAVKVLVFFIVIHQLENHIVVPKIMGHSIDLHPVIVIISLLIGGQLLGVVGMILAVPVAAILRVLFKHLWRYE